MDFRTVRLPAKFLSCYSLNAVRIWLWVRAHDVPGAGTWRGHLSEIAAFFNRSERTIRKWLATAQYQGLLRHYHTDHGVAVSYYASLERAAAVAGLGNLGAIAEISLDELRNLSIVATETVAEGQQRASFHAAKLAQKELGLKPRTVKPQDIRRFVTSGLHTSGYGQGVLGSDERFLYVSEGFTCYGGSQTAIAEQRGVSVRTVQRHLSNSYRLTPSPGTNQREGLDAIAKRQIAIRRPAGVELEKLRFGAERCKDGFRYIERWGRVFHLRTNIYEPLQILIPCRHRRRSYRNLLSVCDRARSGSGDKNSLYFPDSVTHTEHGSTTLPTRR